MIQQLRIALIAAIVLVGCLSGVEARADVSITDIQTIYAGNVSLPGPVFAGPPTVDITAINFSGGNSYINGYTGPGPTSLVNTVVATQLNSVNLAAGGADPSLFGPTGGILYAVFALQGTVSGSTTLYSSGMLEIRENSTFDSEDPTTWAGTTIATLQIKPQEGLLTGRLFGLPQAEDPPNAVMPDLEMTPSSLVNIGNTDVGTSTIDLAILFESLNLDADGDTNDFLSGSQLEASGKSGNYVLMWNSDSQFQNLPGVFGPAQIAALDGEFSALLGENFENNLTGGSYSPNGIDFFTNLQGMRDPRTSGRHPRAVIHRDLGAIGRDRRVCRDPVASPKSTLAGIIHLRWAKLAQVNGASGAKRSIGRSHPVFPLTLNNERRPTTITALLDAPNKSINNSG